MSALCLSKSVHYCLHGFIIHVNADSHDLDHSPLDVRRRHMTCRLVSCDHGIVILGSSASDIYLQYSIYILGIVGSRQNFQKNTAFQHLTFKYIKDR